MTTTNFGVEMQLPNGEGSNGVFQITSKIKMKSIAAVLSWVLNPAGSTSWSGELEALFTIEVWHNETPFVVNSTQAYNGGVDDTVFGPFQTKVDGNNYDPNNIAPTSSNYGLRSYILTAILKTYGGNLEFPVWDTTTAAVIFEGNRIWGLDNTQSYFNFLDEECNPGDYIMFHIDASSPNAPAGSLMDCEIQANITYEVVK